ncbi:MAG: glucosyl-3-phosphoglycerate synthase [Acidimicrobiia bacterium]
MAAAGSTSGSGLERSFRHEDFDPAELAKAKQGRTISLCIPAKNEEATVGAIVERIIAQLVVDVALLDEVLVLDDGSTDATAKVARAAGARVESTMELLPELPRGTGKGEALWKSVYASTGDLIVWVDADIVNFGPHFLTGLLGPLVTDRSVGFSKGFYDRPIAGQVSTGGRVTELVARPTVSLLHPQLSWLVQPLSGEYAGRRDVLESVPFVQHYGVDIGLLIDISRQFGIDAIVQVDLGERVHRNRTLDELSPQSLMVMQTAITKAAIQGVDAVVNPTLVRPGLPPLAVPFVQRPPLDTLPSYRARHTRLQHDA